MKHDHLFSVRCWALMIAGIVSTSFSTLLVAQQSQAGKGFPSRTGEIDIRTHFAQPPKGYGNVPFYWWTGDSLNIERLSEQLDILSDASVDGFAVSYNHTHSEVDSLLNADFTGNCGRVQAGAPEVFSDEWWTIWNQFASLCADKGIGVGMDDYVVAWPGNGGFIDEVLSMPGIGDHQGRLRMTVLSKDEPKPGHVVSEVLKPGTDSLFVVYSIPSPELSPIFGQKMIERYFEPFMSHTDSHAREGMNYFFQDELQYNLSLQSWTPDMAGIFAERKGYDILPLLPALFTDMGPETSRIRLDYADVVTELAAERYFKPIYNWHASRGLIYGSDNEGRGTQPTRYLDYFQTEKWFTAPGNDAPSRGSSFTQTKVSSSVAHLYCRPRTWLEAFHSMGWDANGALLTHQLDHHIIAGGNLLCMHGLYYSTHGGWWEWAPPCFHFRMPYWPHMKVWLKYAERLCFVMSQGVHVADVAVLYPTETMQAYPDDSGPWSTFSVTNVLSPHGCDYDFIDFTSLQSADVSDAALHVSDETYRALVLVDTRALHAATLDKINEFLSAGGLVIASGELMPELADDDRIVFADTPEAVLAALREHIQGDFRSSSDQGRVLHRRIGDQNVYMVMDVNRGDTLFFRTQGKLEVWDAQHGTIREIPVVASDKNGTLVIHEAEAENSRLYVFSPGEPTLMPQTTETDRQPVRVIPLSGDWDITVVPTMNNKWGDYRLPASEGIIGVEQREMEAQFIPASGAYQPPLTTHYGYAPYMETLTVDGTFDAGQLQNDVQDGAGEWHWSPYPFSWQYGVFDSPGGQGWHGLKMKVDSRFLILDKGGHQLFRTRVYAPREDNYRLVTEGVAPTLIHVDGVAQTPGLVYLTTGWHSLLVAYANTIQCEYTLSGMRSQSVDRRERSMVVFYPAEAPEPKTHTEYEHIVASKWYQTDHLVYDPYGGERGEWCYRFLTAPGTRSMHFDVQGDILSLTVNGQPVKIDPQGNVTLRMVNPHPAQVVVKAKPALGCPGTAFFTEPVTLTTEGGRMPAGDWTEQGAMKFYSGGVNYSRNVTLAFGEGQRAILDLGSVDATAQVSVNGKLVDVLLAKPYRLDITDYLTEGSNHIEVLVYSSLSNHYISIPSPYKGTPHAGLLGPVAIEVMP